jgi:uncharacterized membrane protein
MEAMKHLIPWVWALHVLGAFWVSAGVFTTPVVRALMRRDDNLAAQAFALRVIWRIMTLFAVPGAVFTGVLGFYLIDLFHLGYRPGWIKLSVILFVVMLLGMLLVQLPYLRKAMRATQGSASAGQRSPEHEQLASSPLPWILMHVNALIVVILFFLMAFKPI